MTTEEDNEQTNSNAEVETQIEEPKVDLKAEIEKGVQHSKQPAQVKAQEKLETLAQNLSPEQIVEVKKILESSQSSAADGAKRKAEAALAKDIAAGKYQTDAQVQDKIDAALADKDAVDEAYRQFDRTLMALGIAPGSKEADKVADAYKSMGAGPSMLQSEDGVKALAIVAGVLKSADEAEKESLLEDPALGFGSHTVLEAKSINGDQPYKRGDLDRLARENALKAIGGLG